MDDWLRDVKPQWAKIINPPAGFVIPGVANSLVRIWTDNIDAGYIAGGRQGGRDFVRSMWPRWQQNPATCYSLWNEPDVNTNAGIANLAQAYIGAVEQASALGTCVCVGEFPEGNPHNNNTGNEDATRWKLLQFHDAFRVAADAGMPWAPHAYWRPGVEGPTGRWHALGRIAWDLDVLDIPNLRTLVSECGIDGGIAGYPGQQGWQQLTTEVRYRAEIVAAEEYARTIPGLEALMLFGFGAQHPWESFDIPESFARSLVAPLRAVSAPPPVTPEPQPSAVVMAIVNTDKAWYSADSVFGPYDGHPERARDWNLETGGNTDLGEPLQAPCDGYVVYAANAGGGHGLVVSFVALVDGELVNWHWKHLQRADIKQWQRVAQGERIGAVGNAYGQYSAHLHEEIVVGAITGPTHDWRDPAFEYVDPAEWYKAHGADAALVDRLVRYDGR